jgi:hypothetical protein
MEWFYIPITLLNLRRILIGETRRKQLKGHLYGNTEKEDVLGSGTFGVATLIEAQDANGAIMYRHVLKKAGYAQTRDRAINSVNVLLEYKDAIIEGTLLRMLVKDVSLCPLLITQRIIALNNKGMQFPEQYGFSILLNQDKNAIMLWESMEYIDGLNVASFLKFVECNVLAYDDKSAKFEDYIERLIREFPHLSKIDLMEELYLQTLGYNQRVRDIDPDLIDLDHKNTMVIGHTRDLRGNPVFQLRGIDPIVAERTLFSKIWSELSRLIQGKF